MTEIKRHATQIIATLRETREPLLVTEHGREAAVMLDVESYRALVRRLEVLEGIARGERAFSEGRTTPHGKAQQRLARWLDEDG